MKRISMWSGPRNVSTAIMYSFFHRGDCYVIDEPFYAHYLSNTALQHPGREEIIEDQNKNVDQVIHDLTNRDYGMDILFMKNMPHHMSGINLDFVSNFENFFLIREPRAMIASYLQKLPDVKMTDLGLDEQFQLFQKLATGGNRPLVIDSYELLKAPEAMLNLLCEQLEIPYSRSMIHWEPGPIKGDGIWAKYWYGNVHASTGFSLPKEPGHSEIPAHLENLAQECEQYYYKLKQYELKA